MKTLLAFCLQILLVMSAFSQKSADLKLSLEKNKPYHFLTTSDQNISQSMGGMQQTTTVKSQLALTLKMVDAGPGFLVAEARFDSMVTATEAMGKLININSNNEGDMQSEEVEEIMTSIMHRFCNNPLFLRMGLDGEVLAIMNLDVFKAVVSSGVDSISGQAAPMVKMQVNNMVTEGALKTMIEGFTRVLPGKPVEKGEQWTVKMPVNSGGMSFLTVSNYKLNDINDGKAIVSADANVEPAGSEPMDMGGMKIAYNELKGLSKSDLTIDTGTGLVNELNARTTILGTMHIEMGANKMDIPVEIKGTARTIQLY